MTSTAIRLRPKSVGSNIPGQREALEALLMEAEEKAVKGLTDVELEGYFGSGDRD